jgi:hypothetical protein
MISSVIRNLISGHDSEGGYAIRTNRKFVSEFNFEYEQDRTERAFNLIACAYPLLFPYGQGGFSTCRQNGVTFIKHIQWSLRYYDRRFATHHSFPFVVFAIWQKLQALISAKIQINRKDFEKDSQILSTITKQKLEDAIKSEKANRPIKDHAVLTLMKHIRAMNARVVGSDESRAKYRAQIYGTTITENPPNIWTTWNINDIDEPIVHILIEDRISMDALEQTKDSDSQKRARNVAANPKIVTEVFHFIVNSFLIHLFGIDSSHRDYNIRRKGILGLVNAYFGTIEAQGRGSLHLHMIMWLSNSPVYAQMHEFLQQENFRAKVEDFISKCIKAHIEPYTREMIDDIPKEKHLAYSISPDPNDRDFETKFAEFETRIVRNQQMHNCNENTCLKYNYSRKQILCKRHAPWELSSETVVSSNGNWKPKRLHPYLNNWNPILAVYGRMNHDIKWISNGRDTRDVSFYITKYSTKPALKSHNITPLIARGLDYHNKWPTSHEEGVKHANKLLLFRCFRSITRDMEYSAPQVMSYLMGYGDHIASHHYTKFYWCSLESAIKNEFPELKFRR